MLSHVELAVLATAEANDGVFTRHAARAIGMTDGQIDSRLKTGRWVQVQPRVFRTAGVPFTWKGRVRAAVLGASTARSEHRRVAASHATAAALLSIERAAGTERIEITVDDTARPDLWDVVVHRSRDLPACDTTEVDGITVTSGARTCLDLAPRFDRVDAVALADDIIGARLASRSWLHRRASALQNGRRNVSYLAWITSKDGEQEYRSWLERHSGDVFRDGGLPEPRWNVPIREHGRLLGIADTLFDPFDVTAELDGPRFHERPDRVAKDRRRDRDIQISGLLVLRFGYWEIVKHPDRVVDTLRRALMNRGWRP